MNELSVSGFQPLSSDEAAHVQGGGFALLALAAFCFGVAAGIVDSIVNGPDCRGSISL